MAEMKNVEEKTIEAPGVREPTEMEFTEGGVKAWMSVAASFLFNISTWAVNSSYAVYLAHYLKYETFPDASKLDYAAIGGLAFGTGMLFSPIVRLILRTFGLRVCIGSGAVLQFIGIMLAAFSTTLWEVYMTQGLMMGLSLALIALPSITIIPQWFRKKRGLAVAIGVTGSGVGGILFNLALQSIVDKHGLKWALIVEAIICSTCTVTGLILVRSRADQIKINMSLWDWSMLKHSCFWLFSCYVIFTVLGYVVLMYNLADFTISLGYSSHDGSVVSCMIAVGIVFGRPMIGKLSDMFGCVTVAIFANISVSIFCFAMWIPTRNLASVLVFALIQGGTMGTIWVVLAPVAIRLFGLRKMDISLGMIWIVIGSCGLASPIIGIELRSSAPQGKSTDPTQYLDPAIWCGSVYLAGAIVMWFIRGYLISRDEDAEKLESHADNDELHIPVNWHSSFKNLFSLSKTRKV
uniref:MFS transporter n=1 Tax=Cyberlindnera americana TaxID=36016 RepID=A0A5P8N9D4_9ASCO|nr:MFS transporter [Cyberlindnera americana]